MVVRVRGLVVVQVMVDVGKVVAMEVVGREVVAMEVVGMVLEEAIRVEVLIVDLWC